MTREIRFRAWNIETKKMVNNLTVKDGKAVAAQQTSGNDFWDVKYIHLESLILMQYTGLKDANKAEGYEDDIAEELSTGKRYKIIFIDGEYVLDNEKEQRDIIDLECMYIIGNMHENPELLSA